MFEWWSALSLDLQVFYGIGILTTVLLIIQLIRTMCGAGADGALDDVGTGGAGFEIGAGGAPEIGVGDAGAAAGDAHHASGLGLISMRTVIAFLAGFGWTGAIARGGGLSLVPAVLLAVVVGFVLMVLVFWLMRGLYSLRESGSLDYHNAVGAVGTVYVRIPAAGGGSGQIQILVQGRLATVAATTQAPAPIPSGQQVKVVKLLAGNTLLVETL